MIFGKPPVLTVSYHTIFLLLLRFVCHNQSGRALVHCEKKREEIPKWEDLNVYKYAGGAIIGFAALLLIIFIII